MEKKPYHVEYNNLKSEYDKKVEHLQNGGASIDRTVKPPLTYHKLIRNAILDSFTGHLSLQDIYAWIQDKYGYYADRDEPEAGWKNSIRHNLSLLKCFVQQKSPEFDTPKYGHGGEWSFSNAICGNCLYTLKATLRVVRKKIKEDPLNPPYQLEVQQPSFEILPDM